jgi:hypothetical protein
MGNLLARITDAANVPQEVDCSEAWLEGIGLLDHRYQHGRGACHQQARNQFRLKVVTLTDLNEAADASSDDVLLCVDPAPQQTR